MSGIFLTEGISLHLRNITLTIGEGTEPTGTVDVDLRFDACAAWAKIAILRLQDAMRARSARIDAWQLDDEQAKGTTLEAEFNDALQAIVAAVSSVDAFYAVVKEIAEIPEDLSKSWAKNRTSRDKQVAETLKVAFSVSGKSIENLRPFLNKIYKLRGAGLHPSGKLNSARFHPELVTSQLNGDLLPFVPSMPNLLFFDSLGLIWDIVNIKRKLKDS